MNCLILRSALIGTLLFSISGVQAAKIVLQVDSLFKQVAAGVDSLSTIKKHLYNTTGQNIADSLYNATMTMYKSSRWTRTFDANGNVATMTTWTGTGAMDKLLYANHFVYNAQNKIAIDSFFFWKMEKVDNVPTWIARLGSRYASNYDANGKHTVDTLTGDAMSKILDIVVYTYMDSGFQAVHYDSTNVKQKSEIHTFVTGDSLIKRVYNLDNADAVTGYSENFYDTDKKLTKTITYDGTGKQLNSTRYGYGELAIRYGLQRRAPGTAVSSFSIIGGQNRTATVNFELRSSTKIKVQLYDVSGKTVNTIAKGIMAEGTYSVKVRNLSNGKSYILRITTDTGSLSQQFSVN